MRDLRTYQKIIVVFGLISLFLVSWLNFLRQSSFPLPSYHAVEENAISNNTLGFEKIYALALPDRKDRIRPLIDAANATNITLTVLNAVRDKEIKKESWPAGWDESRHRGGELGCLVSHLRTWNKMITTNISSALVLESDADWDLRIARILRPLPLGIQTIVDFPFTNRLTSPNSETSTSISNPDAPSAITPHTPYGTNWDIIWLGHCGSNHEGWGRIYSWNDSAVPPEDREYLFDIGLQADQHIPGTRALYQFGRTTCSTGYAITLRGAKKLSKYFREASSNLDIELSSVCTRHADMVCLGVWPQIITAATTASNIDHSGDGDSVGGNVNEGDEYDIRPGPALQFSARVNAWDILKEGAGSERWKGEWDTMWVSGNETREMVPLNRTVAFR